MSFLNNWTFPHSHSFSTYLYVATMYYILLTRHEHILKFSQHLILDQHPYWHLITTALIIQGYMNNVGAYSNGRMILAKGKQVLGEQPVCHKPNINCPGIKPMPLWWEASKFPRETWHGHNNIIKDTSVWSCFHYYQEVCWEKKICICAKYVYRGNPVEMQPHDLVILMLLFSVLFWGDMVESTALGL